MTEDVVPTQLPNMTKGDFLRAVDGGPTNVSSHASGSPKDENQIQRTVANGCCLLHGPRPSLGAVWSCSWQETGFSQDFAVAHLQFKPQARWKRNRALAAAMKACGTASARASVYDSFNSH